MSRPIGTVDSPLADPAAAQKQGHEGVRPTRRSCSRRACSTGCATSGQEIESSSSPGSTGPSASRTPPRPPRLPDTGVFSTRSSHLPLAPGGFCGESACVPLGWHPLLDSRCCRPVAPGLLPPPRLRGHRAPRARAGRPAATSSSAPSARSPRARSAPGSRSRRAGSRPPARWRTSSGRSRAGGHRREREEQDQRGARHQPAGAPDSRMTAVSVEPVRSYSSRMRERMNTS